jgi:hypothetical protein
VVLALVVVISIKQTDDAGCSTRKPRLGSYQAMQKGGGVAASRDIHSNKVT